VSALGQPAFEVAGGFDDVHAGNDSDGEKGKSRRAAGLSLRIVLKGRSPQRHRDTEKTFFFFLFLGFLCGSVPLWCFGATWQMKAGAGRRF
jgi:hypothetical protein